MATVVVAAIISTIWWSGFRESNQIVPEKDIIMQTSKRNAGNNTAHTNHLIHEKSPYLLQHAHNQVDWYPWGDEAFTRADEEDKPIFLSIGYSTCHWCHVMERESFEDPEVANLLNETFICIKVDREERPDIDNVYMRVCQMMTGSGGWPLTIIMTPEKEPFFAGTYFPKETRFGRIGMMELVPHIKEIWENRRQEAVDTAGKIAESLNRTISNAHPNAHFEFTASTLERAFQQLSHNYDELHGGFGGEPKFPSPHNLLFLLRYSKRTGDKKALQMVEKTLIEMRRGGIYDQVGYGFHRYSTDAKWLLPHFEKMLYDQAMLVMAYTEAALATGNNIFEKTAREILTYVLRDMRSVEGGFYSAEDADSEGEEGKYYLWTEQEIKDILGAEQAEVIAEHFNFTGEGNFAEEASGENTGANILHLTQSLEETAKKFGMTPEELQERVIKANSKLYQEREKRVHPYKDDKILLDWNGLMIAALAKAAMAFDEPKYTEAAKRCADFILKDMSSADNALLHRYRGGEAGIHGNLDDYAFFVWGLIELYEATFEAGYLRSAIDLNRYLIDHFWDDQDGGFYFSSDEAEKLLAKYKEIYDGAIPSGNSVAALNLIRLAKMTSYPDFEEMVVEIGKFFATTLEGSPSNAAFFMTALEFAVGDSYEVVISGIHGAEDTNSMIKAIRENYIPNKVVIFRPTVGADEIVDLLSTIENQVSIEGRATAYVCQNFNCNLPTTKVDEMLRQLAN